MKTRRKNVRIESNKNGYKNFYFIFNLVLDELTYHEPKADQLETLKDLGIDISFLDAFKPGASERVENIQSLLDYIADVIPKLRKGSSTFSNVIIPGTLILGKIFDL